MVTIDLQPNLIVKEVKQMSALLSWDDFEDDAPIKDAADQSAALRAAENIKNLDTTEAEKELDQQGKSIEHSKALAASGLIPPGGTSAQPLFTPGLSQTDLKAANQDAIERAKKIIATMDAQLESGGRVNVAEKYLLNCQADLNQLVPFKYPAFWSLYLTSCECHWMPAELGMEKDKATLLASGDATKLKFLSRFFTAYMFRIRDFSSETLLNIYRMITNPECRQYILRQAFENAAITHAMTDLKDIFNPNSLMVNGEDISKQQWAIDRTAFIERSRGVIELTTKLRDFEATTEGLQNTSDFLEQLLYIYGYTNWTMMITPIYQLMASNQQTHGLQKLCVSLLRDMQNQLSFITAFMTDVFAENPNVLTPDFIQRVNANFDKFHAQEMKLISSCNEYKEVGQIVRQYMTTFLNDCNVPCDAPTIAIPKDAYWFVKIVGDLQPKVSHDAGLGGNGGSLGW